MTASRFRSSGNLSCMFYSINTLRLGFLQSQFVHTFAFVLEHSKQMSRAMSLILLELPGPKLRAEKLIHFFQRSPLERVSSWLDC